MESANLDKFLREEFIDLILKLSLCTHVNEKTVAKYPKLCATVEPIL